jgi:hypothetical protein
MRYYGVVKDFSAKTKRVAPELLQTFYKKFGREHVQQYFGGPKKLTEWLDQQDAQKKKAQEKEAKKKLKEDAKNKAAQE